MINMRLLEEFKAEAVKKNLNIARSNGLFWWKETEAAWKSFKIHYGICGGCGELFSLTRQTCTNCGESDEFEIWKGGEK